MTLGRANCLPWNAATQIALGRWNPWEPNNPCGSPTDGRLADCIQTRTSLCTYEYKQTYLLTYMYSGCEAIKLAASEVRNSFTVSNRKDFKLYINKAIGPQTNCTDHRRLRSAKLVPIFLV